MKLRTIKITNNDWVIENGSTVVLEDKEALAQILCNRASLWLGEWFLDVKAGVDWLGLMDQKVLLKQRCNAMLRKAFLEDERVTGVMEISIDYNNLTAELSAEYEIQTIFGAISGSAGV